MGTDEKLVPGQFLMPGKMPVSADCIAGRVNNYQQVQGNVSEITNVSVYKNLNEEIANV